MRMSSALGWKIVGTTTVVGSLVLVAAAAAISIDRPNEPMPAARQALLAEAPKQIAVIGDSLTSGSGDGGNGPNNWTELAWRQLRTEGVDVIPEVSGRGGSGYVRRGPEETTFVEEAARIIKPDDDVIVIFGGTNDFAEPLPDIAAAVHETLAHARTTAPEARLIIVGPVWPPNLDQTYDVLRAHDELQRVRDVIRDEAAQVDATFVDPIADQWFVDGKQLIGHDHPTDAGHVYMSERLVPVLRSALAPTRQTN